MKQIASKFLVTGALALTLATGALVGGNAFWSASHTAFAPSFQPSHQSAYKPQLRNGQSAYKPQPHD